MKVQCKYDELVNISDLRPHPKNPNKHPADQLKRLAQILDYQGWRYPVKVSKATGFVTSGHGRIEAAKENGWKQVPVNYQEYESAEQEYADLVADNSIASWSELDFSSINLVVPDLGPDFDIDLLGIKDFQIDVSENGEGDPDEIPESPKVAKSRLGDLFLLGEHRLLCGDSTDAEQVARLMNDEKADMVFTDPPYGMKLDANFSSMKGSSKILVGNKGNEYRQVIGDGDDFSPSLIRTIFDNFDCPEIFLWGADYYVEELRNRNDGSWVIWDKRQNDETDDAAAVSADKAFGSAFEMCWSKSRHQRIFARIRSGIFGVKNELGTTERCHPTQKPVQLAEWFFDQWGANTKVVADLYLGSGSTMIACEKTNRRCFGMEIDPLYVDVILERFAKFSGKDPVREDGVKWSEIKNS